MLKKKKPSNKQNLKYKKIPQLTIPSNFHTEQIRIPTASSMDLKSFNRTIQPRKNPTLPTKKSISRKSTIQSIKPSTVLHSPNFHCLLKDFREMKLVHQNSSKSPKSCKSKSNKKMKTNKTSFQYLKHHTLNLKNSSLKLQKTLKKLNLTDLFREQLSQLPIGSLTQDGNLINEIKILQSDNEEAINMVQLRQFCQIAGTASKKIYPLSIKDHHLHKQDKAARKIQQAWKRFRTKRIIQRYAFYIKSRISHRIDQEPSSSFFSDPQEQHFNLFSSDLYHRNGQQEQIRQISQLSQKEDPKEPTYEELIENIKLEQLNKWDEIISIIKGANKNNTNDIQRLIATITEKSEINRQRLEGCRSACSKIDDNKGKNDKQSEVPYAQQKKEAQILPKILKQPLKLSEIVKESHMYNKQFQAPSRSENSVQDHEEYNCRKYVNSLDNDVFPSENGRQITQKYTISKEKQEDLLNKLKCESFPCNLGENKLYNSNSLISLNPINTIQIIAPLNSKRLLNTVTSEKALKYSLKCCSEESLSQSQVNLQQLQQQYLQSGILNVDKGHGKHLATDRSDENELDSNQNEFIQFEIPKEERLRNQQAPHPSFERSGQAFDMYPDVKQSQQLSFFKMHTVEQEELPSCSEIVEQHEHQQSSRDRQQEIQDVSIIIFNSLVLETLRDISVSDHMAVAFKKYSRMTRPKIRHCQNEARKKVFPTDKREIQSFLDGIISYLKMHQQGIFRNLSIPTGPSALEMLKYLHQSAQQDSMQISACNQQDEANLMVIPNRIFQLFWQVKQRSIIVEVPFTLNQSKLVAFKQNLDFLKNINKIFYRNLFDTFNQCLDYSRNFGLFGRPFPWKPSSFFDHKATQSKIDLGIVSARKRMMDLATTYCGLIIQKQELGEVGGSEEYIKQVQEDRLSRMLANDLLDCQSKWVFYDDEEAEILIELSELAYREVIKDCIQELYLLV